MLNAEIKYVALVFPLLLLCVTTALAEPVFSHAEGYGSEWQRQEKLLLTGAATKVFTVSTLNDSGVGSLRDCLEQRYPRVCVFTISGEIKLKKHLRIDNAYAHVAGQTAPSPGVVLSGAGIQVQAPFVVLEHFEVRVGDAVTGPNAVSRDSIMVGSEKRAVHNVLIDHVSLSWAIDENFSTGYPTTRNISLSNSIVSEGLEHSIHPKGPHSKGILIGDGSSHISIIKNLIAHNFERNPYFKPGSSGEFVNNVVFNWGGRGGYNIANVSDTAKTGLPCAVNFIGNTFIPGPDSIRTPPLYGKPVAPDTKIFARDNVLIGSEGSPITSTIPSENMIAVPAIALSSVVIQESRNALESVLKSAGSRPKERNAVDAALIAQVRSRGGKIPDCLLGCPRTVSTALRVVSNVRTLTIPHDLGGDKDSDGLTNLEEWLTEHRLAVE